MCIQEKKQLIAKFFASYFTHILESHAVITVTDLTPSSVGYPPPYGYMAGEQGLTGEQLPPNVLFVWNFLKHRCPLAPPRVKSV